MDVNEAEFLRLIEAKQARRMRLARLPMEEKIAILVRLQEMAAPILRAGGRRVVPWKIQRHRTL